MLDTELINLAEAALDGRIVDPARSASILQRAADHLRNASWALQRAADETMRQIMRDADPEAYE